MIRIGIGLAMLFAMSLLAAEKPLTVCEVLSNLDKYRATMIAIRGVMSGGQRHGYALYQYNQTEDPCPDVLKRGLRWPSSISITWPEDEDVEDGPRTFQPEIKQTNKNMAEVRRLLDEKYRKGKEDLAVIVTLYGEVRARKDILIFQREDGSFYGTGYGPGGQRPAHLVLKNIKAVELKQGIR